MYSKPLQKIYLGLILIFFSTSLAQLQAQQKISGTVTDGSFPIKNVVITIKGNDDVFHKTNANGKYELIAEPRQEITYSYPSMKTVTVIVEDVSRVINIKLFLLIEKLDEVVVTKKKTYTQKDLKNEFYTNKSTVKTAHGYLNKETTGLTLRIIDGEKFSRSSTTFLQTIASNIPGASVRGGSPPKLFLRPGNSIKGETPVLFDIDGMLYSNNLPDIDVNNILRVAVISSLQMVSRYGSDAIGGVVVINTKSMNTPYAQGRVSNKDRPNYYKGGAVKRAQANKSKPSYLLAMEKAAQIDRAKEAYVKNLESYKNSHYYILDAYQHFYKQRKDVTFANNIITDNFGLFENNPMALKALAYIYQTQKRYKKANEIYIQIFKLRPKYVQSYRDLANSYEEIGDQKKAVVLYTRLNHLIKRELLQLESENFNTLIGNELAGLLDRMEIDSFRKTNKTIAFEDSKTRIVFEWDNGDAEFELQFVNPEKLFFLWKHTQEDREVRIQEEKLEGYSSEEQFIDGIKNAYWQINAKYLGNKSLTPTYLKTTVYYNFGTSNQIKVSRLHKLFIKNVNVELVQLNNNGIKN